MSERDPMIEIYTFENMQLLEQLEEMLLSGERNQSLSDEQIDEIFRIMHTIKGSSAMMSYDNLALLSHAVEDLFSNIRERRPRQSDWSQVFDIVLNSADVLKTEIGKIEAGGTSTAEAKELIDQIHDYAAQLRMRRIPEPEVVEGAKEPEEEKDAEVEEFLDSLGRYYRAQIFFENDCKMENIRAFGIVNAITNICTKIATVPEDLLDSDNSDVIAANGFEVYMQSTDDGELLRKNINDALFLRSFEFEPIDDADPRIPAAIRKRSLAPQEDVAPTEAPGAEKAVAAAPAPVSEAAKQSYISVNINKLDKLMDLVGEIVISESMVTKNPDLNGLQLSNFEKAARELRKRNDELQEIVTSIRMVPVSTTFHKMQRLVRDMCKKVHKEADLIIIGEETEVDKNIIDNLSDPLMHLIRNSMDHGLETPAERVAAGKNPKGTITLEARNTGGDVLILVMDDGRGLNREKIVKKAIENGLTSKSESEISDMEAYSFILLPGFSTKDEVTEFSGRGVGMDVVHKNIAKVGGSVSVDSRMGHGTTTSIRIPLTLAIVAGMMVSVGVSTYIIPLLSIHESFKVKKNDVIIDPDGNEMYMIRGEVYPILRLHSLFRVDTEVTDLEEGIILMIDAENSSFCLFVDRIISEQQAVVKPMPEFIVKNVGRIRGLTGCTVMGDGSISLILDINDLAQQATGSAGM